MKEDYDAHIEKEPLEGRQRMHKNRELVRPKNSKKTLEYFTRTPARRSGCDGKAPCQFG